MSELEGQFVELELREWVGKEWKKEGTSQTHTTLTSRLCDATDRDNLKPFPTEITTADLNFELCRVMPKLAGRRSNSRLQPVEEAAQGPILWPT